MTYIQKALFHLRFRIANSKPVSPRKWFSTGAYLVQKSDCLLQIHYAVQVCFASMVLQNADVIILANAEGSNTELTCNFNREILEKQSCTPMNCTLLRPLPRRVPVLRRNWSTITAWSLYPQILYFILIVLISRFCVCLMYWICKRKVICRCSSIMY